MDKLSQFFKDSYGKFKSMSNMKKIALGVGFAGVLIAIIYLTVSLSSTKYSTLFSNLDSSTSKAVIDQLKQQKVTSYKVSGNSILVPTDQVDELRLQIAPVVDGDTTGGWALFDSGSTFGTTDAEMKIKYQRALQSELEKTIKSFPQIDKARVALVLPDDSVFVKDSTPASASITLIMKSGQTLNQEQVKAIVALVSGSVKNLPKENVQIVDDKMTLLTQGLFDNNGTDSSVSTSTDKQQELKSNYEKQLEAKVMDQLSKPFKNKVTVKVNADLDFDAVQNDTTTVDPKNTVIVSEHNIKNSDGSQNTTTSQSPVDNNMTNTTPTNNTTNNTSTNGNVTNQDETKNYDYGKSETKTVKAPGSVKRITASVIIDGNIDQAAKDQINGLVAGAIGYDSTRGDSISVEGIKFDTTDSDNAQKAINELKAEEDKANRTKLYTEIAAGGIGLIALITLIIAATRKRRKRSPEEEQLEAILSPKGIDVLINDEEDQKPKVEFKPIDFDKGDTTEKTHLENEIKRYASEKPDQVAEIIKSWLVEDER